MKRLSVADYGLLLAALFLMLPATVLGQETPAKAAPPPIGQELIREGDFALRLEAALGLEKSADEAGAESRLGDLGILPRNGWIADYPLTPDILAELQKTVGDAVDAGNIPLSREEALRRLDSVAVQQELAVKPYTGEETYETLPEDAQEYPNPTVINNYYYEEGPPVVTYYAPPPDYYYLYSWVPFPFWCYGFWFPGYFILHDFHRPVHFGHRVGFISNHFNDFRSHRVFRVDPVARYNGRTFAGIGAAGGKRFISTGVPGSARRIFNGPHTWGGPGGRSMGTRRYGYDAGPTRSMRGGRSSAPPAGARHLSPSPGGRHPSSFSGGRSAAPPFSGGRSMAPAPRGGGAGHGSPGGAPRGGGRR